MGSFLSYLAAGLADGFAYALLATGFVVIYRVTHVVNFAQGTFAIVAGYGAWWLLSHGAPHGFAELAAIAAAGLVGLAVGAVAVGKPGTPLLGSLIITLGISIFFYAVDITLFGDQAHTFDGLKGSFLAAGVGIARQYVLIGAIALVAFAGLAVFFNRTYLGKAMTASASNPYAARLCGIGVTRMGLLAFGLGGLLGGLAGVLVVPLGAVTFDGDVSLAVNGFAAAIFGGLMRPWAALGGALVLGLAQSMVAGYYSASFESGIALTLILVLLVYQAVRRPEQES